MSLRGRRQQRTCFRPRPSSCIRPISNCAEAEPPCAAVLQVATTCRRVAELTSCPPKSQVRGDVMLITITIVCIVYYTFPPKRYCCFEAAVNSNALCGRTSADFFASPVPGRLRCFEMFRDVTR
eukprot:SAG31_NODE_14425_length_807_cov_1.220339_2_plen_124_part_00